jgi:multiple antibiotic resistance protein
MTLTYFISALVTLGVVVDPVGLAAIFLGVTRGLSVAERQQVALRSCFIALCILVGAALFGDWLLRTLGISLPAFRIAGGLLLFSIASEMVFGVRTERQSKTAEQVIEDHVRNIAAFPLAIPLMAGPGAITTAVLLSGQANGNPLVLGTLFGVILAVIGACLIVFLLAARGERYLGTTASLVISRLLGVLLAALAVQFVVDGIRAIWA